MVNGLIEQFDSYDAKRMKDVLMRIVYAEQTLVSVKGN